MFNSDTPIFIIGNPRSGTTMFRLMLSSHSKIMIAPESGFMQWWHEKYKQWNSQDNSNKLDDFLNDLFDSRRFEYWKMVKSDLKNYILKNDPKTYAELISLIYKKHALNIGKTKGYWGDKNNYYLNHIDQLNSLYPKAFFIHIIRDGRDVFSSYKRLSKIKGKVKLAPNLPSTANEVAKEWTSSINKINESFSKIKSENKLEIRYEDLVQNTEDVLTKITQLLDLDFESEMLSFHENNKQNAMVPQDYVPWKKETFSKLNKNGIGRYRLELSNDEIYSFEKLAQSELSKNQYTLENSFI